MLWLTSPVKVTVTTRSSTWLGGLLAFGADRRAVIAGALAEDAVERHGGEGQAHHEGERRPIRIITTFRLRRLPCGHAQPPCIFTMVTT